MKLSNRVKSATRVWENKEGYVQPIISARGMVVLVSVFVVALVAAAMFG